MRDQGEFDEHSIHTPGHAMFPKGLNIYTKSQFCIQLAILFKIGLHQVCQEKEIKSTHQELILQPASYTVSDRLTSSLSGKHSNSSACLSF